MTTQLFRAKPQRSLTLLGAIPLITLIFAGGAAAAELSGIVKFDIPAQAMQTALFRFSAQTHVQVVASAGVVANKQSQAVSGELQVNRALAMLLSGTELEFTVVNEHTVAIHSAQRGGTEPPKASAVSAEVRDRPLLLAQAEPDAPASSSAAVQRDTPDDDMEKLLELGEILVTGSRIKRTQIEGAAPVTTITRDEMQREGFTTAYEALYSLTQATGSGLETQLNRGGFTQNATNIDLRGLGPGRVLVLFNGRRASDYPLPFGGTGNVVNLSAIPTAALERIEILSGGASAIYGSDAVAGVVNFIMRDHFDGIAVAARLGATTQGGGETKRFQLTGGINGEAFKAVYALEYFNRKPIWGFQRDAFDSNADNPTLTGPALNERSVVLSDPFDGNQDGLTFIDPTAAVCAQFPELIYSFRITNTVPGAGFFCGSEDWLAQYTIRNQTEDKSVFFNPTYDFDNGLQLFGSLSFWQSDAETAVVPGLWAPATGTVFDVGPGVPANCFYCPIFGGQYLTTQRLFNFSEVGGVGANNVTFDERSWDGVLGLRGAMFDGRFEWEAAYHRSNYDTERRVPGLLNQEANDFFVGPQLTTGTGAPLFDPVFGTVPVHAVPRDRLLRPITPAEYLSISAVALNEGNSSGDQANLLLTGEAFNLPAGAVKFAGLLEWGTQQYELNPDPRVIAGEFFRIADTAGGGERDRYAVGMELAVPILDTLRATLAGRYDQYDDITDVDDAITYNAGLEYRPIKSLLLRGSYATSFRAPDMHFIFAGPSTFLGNVFDEFQCRRALPPGAPISDCGALPINFNSLITGTRVGSPLLEEETGRSWTAGLAWSATDSLNLTADYFDIELDNGVDDLTLAYILHIEADCRLGQLNPSSGLCQNIVPRVIRNPADGSPTAEQIVSVTNGPINRAFQHVRGVDASLNHQLRTPGWGDFFFKLSWSHVLEQERQQFSGDPIESYRDNMDNADLRSRVRGSVTWQKGGWTHTLFGDIQGSRPKFDRTGRTGEYDIYNYSTSFAPSESLKFTLVVDNVFDTDPTFDDTFSFYPFFSTINTNPYGREVFFDVGYQFK